MNILTGIAAFVAGSALAVVTVVGVVEAQNNAGETQVNSSVINYGDR